MPYGVCLPGEEYIMPHRRTTERLKHVTNLRDKKATITNLARRWHRLMCDPLGEENNGDFDAFIKLAESFVKLEPLPEHAKREFVHYYCSCPEFAQYFVCHHCVALGLHLRYFTAPPHRLMESIKRVASRGRPRHAGRALEYMQTADEGDAEPHFASIHHPDASCLVCLEATDTQKNPIVFCDGCSKGFHKKCAKIARIPEGEWLCQYCRL